MNILDLLKDAEYNVPRFGDFLNLDPYTPFPSVFRFYFPKKVINSVSRPQNTKGKLIVLFFYLRILDLIHEDKSKSVLN